MLVAPLLDIAPCSTDAVLTLERELGVSTALAQVLVRRGLGDPLAARAWLEAGERHDPSAFRGIADACALVLRHVAGGGRITVHGDYDVDGITSTAILVGILRELGADADWLLPSRTEDGYGLTNATIPRLVARGTRLLITADCAITAVDAVAAARAAGVDVLITDHHAPRADGVLPDAPIVHPALCGYPSVELCAAAVAHKLAAALLAAAGRDPARADDDLDLVALATVADCVPLRGESRRLVRDGLRALATTARPGLRALMHVADVDPAALDEQSIGFRLAPRINAAGRMARADAGVELLLSTDTARAAEIAEELDRLNAERRHTETRVLFQAEALLAEARAAWERDRPHDPDGPPAFVLAGEDWHAGVIGIVASRLAERHHRPVVLVALDGARGTGSGRSIPGFDLLGGLDAAAKHLVRHGGHRAAAGCEVQVEQLDGFRAAFVAHAAAVLSPDDLVARERVDAVVSGEELGLALAEELERLAPFGMANPRVCLLVPAVRCSDPRPMGEGKHVRFTISSGGVKARAVGFGRGAVPCDEPVDATFTLQRNEWRGSVEPQLVLRHARPCAPAPIRLVGEPADYLAHAFAELGAPLAAPAPPLAPPEKLRDRRGMGIAGTVSALVASGEPVLVVAADAALRAVHLAGIAGGFELCSHEALARDPALAGPDTHVVMLDPPAGGRPARRAG